MRDHGKLESLSLSGMDIDIDVARALVQLSLKELNIISPMAMVLHEPPAAEVYQKLGRSLLSSTSLERLTMYNFSRTVLDSIDDISDNISTLNLDFLPRTDFSWWSTADPKYGTKISHILRGNTSLKELRLKMQLYKDEVCDILHSVEDNHTLEKLVLVDDGYISSYTNVHVLSTDTDRFHSSVVESGTNFSAFLRRNTSLKELQLRMPLDKDEVWDVLHSLEDNHTLEKLVVSSASHYRPRHISLTPMKTELASEQLPANPSHVKGGATLSNFLKGNTSLKELCVEIPLDTDQVHCILHSLEENHTLEKLEIMDYGYHTYYQLFGSVKLELALPAANPSGVKGGTRLGNFLRRNTSLKHLKLFFSIRQ